MALMTASGGLSNGKLALANAEVGDVLSGKTFYAGDKLVKSGTMPNNGAWSISLNAGDSITVPLGYHNGTGKVSVRDFNSRPVSLRFGTGRSPGDTWMSKVYDSDYMSSDLTFRKACRAKINAIIMSRGGTAYCKISCNGTTIVSLAGNGNTGHTTSENTVTLDVNAGTSIGISVGGNYDSRWMIVVFADD